MWLGSMFFISHVVLSIFQKSHFHTKLNPKSDFYFYEKTMYKEFPVWNPQKNILDINKTFVDLITKHRHRVDCAFLIPDRSCNNSIIFLSVHAKKISR